MSDTVTPAAALGRLHVNPGDELVTTWGNSTFDQTVNVFAAVADRDTQWPVAPDGACCYTIAETAMWQYRAGAWQALAGAGAVPVTAGGLVSRVDAAGDVWVAKPGVNGGAWRKARDVVHSRVFRSATWTAGTTNAPLTFDTVVNDPYGCYVQASSAFVCPVAGVYRMAAQVGVVTAAANQYGRAKLQRGATLLVDHYIYSAASGQGAFAVPADSPVCAAGDQLTVQTIAPVSLTGMTGMTATFLAVDYLGTG